MWKLLTFFLTHHKIDRNTTTTARHFVNELVRHRTMGLNHEKLPSGWSLFLHEVYSGVSKTTFFASVQWWHRKLQSVIERHVDSITIMSRQTYYFQHIQSFKTCNMYNEISYDYGMCLITNAPLYQKDWCWPSDEKNANIHWWYFSIREI